MGLSGALDGVLQSLLGIAVSAPVATLHGVVGVLHGLLSVRQGLAQRRVIAASWVGAGSRGGGRRRRRARRRRAGRGARSRRGPRRGSGLLIGVIGGAVITVYDLFTGLSAGVSPEHLVQGAVKGVSEANLFTKEHQHFTQQRILRTRGGLHINRLHVQQAATHRQRQQVTAQHLRGLLGQQVQGLRHVSVRGELVLHLARARHIR